MMEPMVSMSVQHSLVRGAGRLLANMPHPDIKCVGTFCSGAARWTVQVIARDRNATAAKHLNRSLNLNLNKDDERHLTDALKDYSLQVKSKEESDKDLYDDLLPLEIDEKIKIEIVHQCSQKRKSTPSPIGKFIAGSINWTVRVISRHQRPPSGDLLNRVLGLKLNSADINKFEKALDNYEAYVSTADEKLGKFLIDDELKEINFSLNIDDISDALKIWKDFPSRIRMGRFRDAHLVRSFASVRERQEAKIDCKEKNVS